MRAGRAGVAGVAGPRVAAMGPAVREKVRKRPANFYRRPAIWQDEMVEVRETFRRIARVKQSGFTVWDRREIRSSAGLTRNRLARIRSQVPSSSMHDLPSSAARMIQNNRSQSPFVSLNHMKNVVSMCKRIQSQDSLTERRKNLYDPALYPVFIRRPADAGQTASLLRTQKSVNARRGHGDGEVPYAYTPPKFTFLFDVSNGAIPPPGFANRPSSAGALRLGASCSSRPSSSGMYKVWVQERPSTGSFAPLDGSKRLLSRLPAFKKLSDISSAICSSPRAMEKASTDRSYHRIVQDYWPFSPAIKSSSERRLRSAGDVRRSPAFYLERPPSRCTKKASSFSPNSNAEAGETAKRSDGTLEQQQQQQHGNISNRSRSTVSDCVSGVSILDSRSSYIPGRTSSAGSLTLTDTETDSSEDREENSRYLSCMPRTCGLFQSSTEVVPPRFTQTQSNRPPSRKGRRRQGRQPARFLHLEAREASGSSSQVLEPPSIQRGAIQERPGECSTNDAFKTKVADRAQTTQLPAKSSKAAMGSQRPFSAPSHGRLPKRPHIPSEEPSSPARHKLVTFATSPDREESGDRELDLKFPSREEEREDERVEGTDAEDGDREAAANAHQLEQKQMGSRTQEGHGHNNGLEEDQCQELPGERPRSSGIQEGCISSASSCEESGTEDEGHVILKHSADPYVDFKNSMMNMILSENLQNNENELEELFQYYVDLNPAVHHQILHRVIEDIRQELKSPSSRREKITNSLSSCSSLSSS